MIPSNLIARNFTDTARSRPTIHDAPTAPPSTFDVGRSMFDVRLRLADNTLAVLRGGNPTATHLLGDATHLAATRGDSPQYKNLGSLADGDIMAVAFIVMMEAAKSAREDLKSIMDGVKLINKQKDSIRHWPWG